MLRRLARSGKSVATRFREPPWNRHSPEWQAIDAELREDHVARRISEGVDEVELSKLEGSYQGQGELPYPPKLMLKAILYEIQQGRQSPAQWHRDAKENDVVKWLLLGSRPARSRWYAFRDRLAPWIDGLNAQILQQAVATGITPAKQASLDGTLIASGASRHQLANESKLQKRCEELQRAVADDASDVSPPTVPAWMAKRPATRLRQYQRHQVAQRRMAELQAENSSRIPSRRRERNKIVLSVSDPEAALGLDKHKVFRPLYNAQYARDLDSPLILGYQVFAQSSDAGTYQTMLDRVAQFTGRKLEKALADAGYATAVNLAVSERRGVTLYAPWQENDFTPAAKKSLPESQLPKSAFTWQPESQTYRCPAGKELKYVGRETRQRAGDENTVYLSYQSSRHDCLACSLSRSCVKNPSNGRRVRRNEHEELIEAHQQRMQTPEAKQLYRYRKQTVELAFADSKQHRGLRRISGYGLTKARLQTGLTVLIHNLLALRSSLRPRLANAISNPSGP
jgi:transposase